MMGSPQGGDVPAAADLLIEEAQDLLASGEHGPALATLDQASVVAPGDGAIHLMKALARCKAASAELDNIAMLSGPEWGDLALRSRRVEMDQGIYREIAAGEAKRDGATDRERFATLKAHAVHLAARTAESIDIYNQSVDGQLAPFEVEQVDELEQLVQELRAPSPAVHDKAVQSLVRLLLTNPRLPPEEREAAEAKVVSDCLKIARMDRGAGLHVVLTMLNSSAEQDQWAAATVVTTVLLADSSTHDAFVSLGGIQALVCALGSVSPQVQTRCLESLQHLAASIALGSEYGTLDGNHAPPARFFPAFGLSLNRRVHVWLRRGEPGVPRVGGGPDRRAGGLGRARGGVGRRRHRPLPRDHQRQRKGRALRRRGPSPPPSQPPLVKGLLPPVLGTLASPCSRPLAFAGRLRAF